jgi:hypothetical protein
VLCDGDLLARERIEPRVIHACGDVVRHGVKVSEPNAVHEGIELQHAGRKPAVPRR